MRCAAILLALIGAAGAGYAQESSFLETHRVTLRNGNFVDGILKEKTQEGVTFVYAPSIRVFIRWSEIKSLEEIAIRHVSATPRKVTPPPPPSSESKPPPGGKVPTVTPDVKLPKISGELQQKIDDFLETLRATTRLSRGRYAGLLDAMGSEARQYLAVRIELLEDDIVRWVASDIGRSLDQALVPELRRRLRSERPVVRSVAIQLLQEIKDRESGAYVVSLLRDPDEGVRGTAAVALPDLGDESSIEPLAQMMRERSAPVRKVALRALIELARRKGRLAEVVTHWQRTVSNLNAEQKHDVAEAAGQLIPSLGTDANEAATLARAEVEEMLLNLARDIEPAVRGASYKSLAKLTSPEAREAVTNALTSELNEGALVAAIETIQDIRERAGIPHLIDRLDHSADRVRQASHRALQLITGEMSMGAEKSEWQAWADLQK